MEKGREEEERGQGSWRRRMHSMKVAAIGRYGRLEEEARRVCFDSGCISVRFRFIVIFASGVAYSYP